MNFIINNIFLIGIIIACLFWLLLPTIQGRGPNLSPYLLSRKMQETRVVIVDIRTEEEFHKSHMKGAIHLPEELLIEKSARIERYKSNPIVLVCAEGKRAWPATSRLKKAGFVEVASLEGGMKAWTDDGMPVVSDEAANDYDSAAKDKKKGKA